MILQRYLFKGGVINAGIDMSGNNYFSFKYPLSNKFEYDLSFMQIKKINYNSDTKIIKREIYRQIIFTRGLEGR